MMTFQRGFSLLQLIIAISLVLMFFTDLPKKLNIVSHAKVKYEADKFANALWFAKTEAANRGVSITMCKSPDSRQCSLISNWNDGWIVFVDESKNAQVDPVSDEVLRARKGREIDLKMIGAGSAKDYVSFSPDGRLNGKSGQSVAGYVSVCVANELDENARAVKLNTSGKISVVKALEIKGAKCEA